MEADEAFKVRMSQIPTKALDEQIKTQKDQAYKLVRFMQDLPDMGSPIYRRMDTSFGRVADRIQTVGAEIPARQNMPVYSLTGGVDE